MAVLPLSLAMEDYAERSCAQQWMTVTTAYSQCMDGTQYSAVCHATVLRVLKGDHITAVLQVIDEL